MVISKFFEPVLAKTLIYSVLVLSLFELKFVKNSALPLIHSIFGDNFSIQ